MSDQKITMPHRHTVRYQDENATIEYEVELLKNGIVLYRQSPKIISGSPSNTEFQTSEVVKWLQSKFTTVEIDDTPIHS